MPPARHERTLYALMRVACANDPAVLSRVELQNVVKKIHIAVACFPRRYALLFWFNLYLFEYALPPLSWKIRPFSALSPEKQMQTAIHWQERGYFFQRLIFQFLRSVILAAMFSEPGILDLVGYEQALRQRTSPHATGRCDFTIPANHVQAPEERPSVQDSKPPLPQQNVFEDFSPHVMHYVRMPLPAALPNLLDLSGAARDVEETYDVIVVGSGAGGAVVAKELAESGARVALVEEGTYHAEHHDGAYAAILRLYRDAGMTHTLGKPLVLVPLGKCLGGTTTINSGTCFRTPDSVLRHWREERHLEALSPEELDAAFARVEEEIHVTPVPFSIMSPSNRFMHRLLTENGFHGAPLRRNVRHCEGCGMCCYGCTSGAKQSMDRSYLPKALHAGAVAYVHAHVVGIDVAPARDAHHTQRVRGVTAVAVDAQGIPTGRRLRLRAPAVVLAAGTFYSPWLLYRSGIAGKNPHLGRHLTLHPATKVVAEMDQPSYSWEGVPQAYYSTALADEGIMLEGISMPPELGAMAMPFLGTPLAHFVTHYQYMTSFGIMIEDSGEGRMRSVPGMGPVFQYTLTPHDVRRFQRAIAFLARLYFEAGAKTVYAMYWGEGNRLQSLRDLARFEAQPLKAAQMEVMAFHPLGTCRMAARPEEGVCDQNHEVFGVSGLYVCDGSIVPSALGVNPQETIMALATRFAARFLGVTLGPSVSDPRVSSLMRNSAEPRKGHPELV